MPVFWLFFLAVLAPATAFSQDNGRKQASASRVASGSINLDGRLDDQAWRDVPALTDFVQKEPNEGARATDRMEVRFAYDEAALYVGAKMYASAPIQSPLGRRDQAEQAEHLVILLDTYLDRRTASEFGVSASGVRLDSYYPEDNDWPSDPGFNPVWQARTSRNQDGWNAELRIPFSQLRFTDRDPQVWGLNVRRWVPSRNEETFWALIPRTDERWASQFGDLHGISGIRPSRRLELMPYVASGSHLVGVVAAGDPFAGGANVEGRVGLDAKVGLGSNLTLEATVNPDFGQVEADPAEVNLTAFETFFEERRPFFLEGSQLLLGPVNNYFYSRRIGAAPAGRADGDFVEYPSTSTILGAAKLTGRLASGTSIGVLGAVTDEESARTFSQALQFDRVRVAPRTAYGVARLQQEFGAPGSMIGFMMTGVHRPFDADDPLASLLTRNAVTFSADSTIRLQDGGYEIQWFAGATRVRGEPAAIDRLQRASSRYLQRPDADYVVYDPTRTGMSGAKAGASLERRNARRWLWQVSTLVETPEFEPSDIGRLTTADGIQADGFVEYRDTEPRRGWRSYAFRLSTGNEWNFGGVRQAQSVTPRVTVTWPNFWRSVFDVTYNGRAYDARLTRGGPLMQTPQGWETNLEVQSSDASQTRVDLVTTYGRNEDGGVTLDANATLTLQPAPQWQLSVRPAYEREVNTQQYVTTLSGGGAATFQRSYVFAHVDRSTYSTQIRMNYTFKPDLTLDFYGEPFAASGRYDHIGQLAAARSRLTSPLDVPLPARDFNVQSFRSNLVLRWEWRAGSLLYLVWQQDRSSEEALRDRISIGDMFRSLGRSGDNFFAVKASFWFSPS
jgi:hypothetical protein